MDDKWGFEKVIFLILFFGHFLFAAAPVEEAEDAEEENHNGEAAPEAEKTEEVVEAEPSEAPPAEQARGLGGLLANRRRPLLRRPGNLA